MKLFIAIAGLLALTGCAAQDMDASCYLWDQQKRIEREGAYEPMVFVL